MGEHRFVCRFAVGQNGLAYSAVWRLWAARKKPDLYFAVRSLAGELKATVHAPYPPHTGWERHFGFPKDAVSIVSQEAKREGGPHKVRWSGYQLAPSVTLEYRVIIRGTSLEEKGTPVENNVALLPMPSTDEYVQVYVILGQTGPTEGYPRARTEETYLLSEGRLSDDRRVWVVYTKEKLATVISPEPNGNTIIQPKISHGDPFADFKNAKHLRAILFGAQEDGSLLFFDMKATAESRT